jgi:4-amino-4-deoxy-L-arabinose transferase-like glycosyltransferase
MSARASLSLVGSPARALWRGWRRIPRAGRACFLIAFVNVAIWSVIVPPFQVPDEISHFSYAQYFAETGSPPPGNPNDSQWSQQEYLALDGLNFYNVIGSTLGRGVFTVPQNTALRAELAGSDPLKNAGASTPATNQPPLYYMLEAIPYWLSPSNDIFMRLAFMRLLSALMAAGTVLAIFLFLRELLPRTPWAWTVGALMVAFQPMFAFIGAGVQADNLLYLASALTFYVLARAWRRGLTTRRAIAIGAVLAIGMLAKLTFLALVPGAALTLLLLVWRERRGGRWRPLAMLGVAVGVAAAPVLLYALANVTVWSRPSALGGALSSATAAAGAGPSAITWHVIADYTWQLYLPRLGFMNHVYFPGVYPLWSVWLDGSVGHFGWLDYSFPLWVYNDFQDLVYALAALAAIGAWRVRRAIMPALGLIAGFAAMALGLLAVIGYQGARAMATTNYPFPQARYLFPLFALYALAIVVVTKAAPRRWAPVLGGLLVALALAHNLFAETLTISRYYG